MSLDFLTFCNTPHVLNEFEASNFFSDLSLTYDAGMWGCLCTWHYMHMASLRRRTAFPITVTDNLTECDFQYVSNQNILNHVSRFMMCPSHHKGGNEASRAEFDMPSQIFDTLRLRPNRRHFANDIFKCVYVNANVWISKLKFHCSSQRYSSIGWNNGSPLTRRQVIIWNNDD